MVLFTILPSLKYLSTQNQINYMDTSQLWSGRNNLVSLKFITLGYSASGKTYYLGSLYRLRANVNSPHGFSVKGQDEATMSRIEEVYRVLANKQPGAVLSTVKMDTAKLTFQKKVTDLFGIDITDIYGQATEAGRNVEEARKLIKSIPEQDGIIIFVKAPSNFDEYDDAIDELNRHLDLAALLLKKKQNIPIALVLTQIDRLEILSQIKEEIDRQMRDFEEQLRDDPDSYMEVEQKLKFVRGDVINPIVKDAVRSPYINGLVLHFHHKLDGYKAACKAFPSTSLGFDNSAPNPSGKGTLVARGKQLNPYGTIASFLWMIYAYTRLNPKRVLTREFGSPDELSSELFQELNDLFMKGDAYEDRTSPIWNARNLGNLHG